MMANSGWHSCREILGSGGNWGEMGLVGRSQNCWHLAGADHHHVRKPVDFIASNLLWNVSAHSVGYLCVYNLILINTLGAVNFKRPFKLGIHALGVLSYHVKDPNQSSAFQTQALQTLLLHLDGKKQTVTLPPGIQSLHLLLGHHHAWCVCVSTKPWRSRNPSVQFSSVSQSCPTLCDPHGLQHARPPCPSPTPRVHPHSCPLSQWCHPTISSSVILFSACPKSFPASRSFQMSQLFASGGQNIGVSASTSALPMNTQDWSPLGWICWISFQSKELSRVFSNTTDQKHQFFCAQLSL